MAEPLSPADPSPKKEAESAPEIPRNDGPMESATAINKSLLKTLRGALSPTGHLLHKFFGWEGVSFVFFLPMALYFADKHRFSGARVFLVFATIALFIKGFLASQYLPVGGWRRSGQISSVVISGLFLWGMLVYVNGEEKEYVRDTPQEDFSVSFKTELIDTTRNLDKGWLWVLYPSGYGQTLSPISLLSFIEITNLQAHEVSISSYSMALKSEPCGWIYLSPIDLSGTLLLWNNTEPNAKPFSAMALIDASGSAFSGIWTKPIPALRTEFGMLLFDTKVACAIEPGSPIQFRLEITDTTGKSSTYFSPGMQVVKNIAPGTSIGQTHRAAFQFSGYSFDASRAYRRLMSDPIPEVIPEGTEKGVVVMTRIPNANKVIIGDGAYSLVRRY